MPKYRVYFTCEEDPFLEIEAASEDEALALAEERYNEKPFDDCFTSHGHFSVDEAYELENK